MLAADALHNTILAHHPWAWMLAGAALAAFVLLGAPARWRGPLLCIALALGMTGWTLARSHVPGQNHLARLMTTHDRIIRVEGIAVSEARKPVQLELGLLSRFDITRPATRFLLETHRLIVSDDGALPSASPERAIPVRGRFWTAIPDEDAPRIRPGMSLRVTGVASAIDPPLNPGARDFRPHTLQDGVAGFLVVPHGTLLEPNDNPPPLERLRGLFFRVRGESRAHSSRVLLDPERSSPGRALLAALLLGERDESLRSVHVSFTRLGLSHLLAISGLNLVVLAGALALLIRALFVLLSVPLSIAWRAEPILVSLAVVAYLFVLPVQPSILRAGVMTLALLIPSALGRRHDRVNMLGWALLFILIRDPYALFLLGLQLSFGVVLALLTLTNPLRDRLFGRPSDPATLPVWRRAARAGQSALVAAAAAWLVSVPAIAHHTGVITPLAVPATLLGAPIVSGLTAGGYLSLILALFVPRVARHTIPLLSAISDNLAHAASFVDDLPYALIRLPHFSVWLACAATVVIVSWLVVPRDALSRFPRPVRIARLAATLLLALWVTFEFNRPQLRADVALRVDSLHVQDGTCILLRAGDASALWDAGGTRFNLGVRTLPDALRTLRARNVRDVFLTHPNLDHFNAIPDLFRALPIERLHTTGFVLREAEKNPDGPEAALLTLARLAGVRVLTHNAGDVVALGPARLRFLWPPATLPPNTHDNDTSLVARFERADLPDAASVLLTGDIQAPTMRALLADPEQLRAEILELPHHGSAGSIPTALRFVEAVRPSIILQSTGISRVDDDRWDSARGPGVTWLTTPREGASWGEILKNGTARWGAMRPPRATQPPAAERSIEPEP